jgi:membrane protease YdiL (CAAX protease family)
VLIRGRGLGWATLGLRPAPRHWLLRAVLVALASLPLVAAVNLATQMLAGGPIRNPQLDIVAPGGFSWRGLIGMVVMAGMVAPMVEEILFRGLLYGWLRGRLGVAAAVVLSAFLFALVHGIPMLMPAIAVQGVLLALLYERSGSLWPAIVMHGTFNAIMTLALYAALAAGLSPT